MIERQVAVQNRVQEARHIGARCRSQAPQIWVIWRWGGSIMAVADVSARYRT